MKSIKFIAAAAVTIVATNTFADDVVFKGVDDNLATQACITAATEGLDAVKAILPTDAASFTSFKRSVTCNGLSLSSFAKRYAQQNIVDESSSTETTQVVRLVTSTNDAESRLCLDAVVMGVNEARAKHGIKAPVSCNTQSLARFVRNFKNKQVEIASEE